MSLKNTIRTFFIFSLLSVSVTACYVPTANTTTTAPTDTVVVPNTTQSSTVTSNSTITTSVSPVVTAIPTDNNGNVVFVSPSALPSSVYATAPS